MIARYQKRISGPLLDRTPALAPGNTSAGASVDIHIDVPRVDYDKLTSERLGEPSAAIRERVEQARGVQRERLAAATTDDGRQMDEEVVYC